eukprot:240777-Rhodomonas_salina.2
MSGSGLEFRVTVSCSVSRGFRVSDQRERVQLTSSSESWFIKTYVLSPTTDARRLAARHGNVSNATPHSTPPYADPSNANHIADTEAPCMLTSVPHIAAAPQSACEGRYGVRYPIENFVLANW